MQAAGELRGAVTTPGGITEAGEGQSDAGLESRTLRDGGGRFKQRNGYYGRTSDIKSLILGVKSKKS